MGLWNASLQGVKYILGIPIISKNPLSWEFLHKKTSFYIKCYKLVIQTYPLNVKLSVTECEWIYELPRILVTGDGKGRREEEIRKVVLYNAKKTHHIDIIQILRQERKCMATTFSNTIIIFIPPTVDGVRTDTQQQTHETWLCRGRLRLRGNT